MDEYNTKGYNIKGLWVTEFAGSAWNADCVSQAAQMNLMKQMIKYFNEDPHIVAYAWFSYDINTKSNWPAESELFNTDGSLTALGDLYFQLGNQVPTSFPGTSSTD